MPVLAWSTFTSRGVLSIARSSTPAPDLRVVPATTRLAIAMQLNSVVPQGSKEIPVGWATAALLTSGAGSSDLIISPVQTPLMEGRRYLFTRPSLFLAGIDGSGAANYDWAILVWLTKYAKSASVEWWDR